MSFKEKLKILKNEISEKNKNKNEQSIDFYESIDEVCPFTVLSNAQFSSFISSLSEDELVSDDVKSAFEALWSCACVDIDGFGNNIWNLKMGQFEIFKKNDIKVQFEKRTAEKVDKYTNQGRASFVFKSNDGNILIHQHDQNRDIFLVYLSSNITSNLFDAVKRAEANSLEIKIREEKNVSTSDYRISDASVKFLENEDEKRRRR